MACHGKPGKSNYTGSFAVKTGAPSLLLIVSLVSAPASLALGDELILAEKGMPKITIFAPGENEWAGKRLANRLFKWTGANVPVQTGATPPAGPGALIAIGTAESNPVAKGLIAADKRVGGLGEEGYILKNGRWQGRPVLVASGKKLAGVNNAVSELLSWKLKLREGGATVSALDEIDKPALHYRIVWTWDGHCIWADSVPETMKLIVREDPNLGASVVPYTPAGFRTHLTRAIDYFSDHKLNGLIVWGFLRDEHGGVEMGREISRYARQNNVRILPGVCSEAAYGGFIFSATNKFNLEVWGKHHPELQGKNEKGETVPGMLCPTKPENQQWLREGAEWLFTNLPDIGGINLENGDFMTCQNEACKLERAKPENDPNCFWDMMASQKPILEVAKRMRPDGWMTFATYVGFTEPAVRSIGQRVAYPPKFLQQMPDNAICQWTFTKMTDAQTWPNGAKPPAASFKEHVGLLHHGSIWGLPVDPARWWASPGAWADEYSTILPFVSQRAASSGVNGIVITGQTGAQFPVHDLNYVALEYFTWHPDRSYQQFRKDRLDVCYGGADRADLFLKLLRGTSKLPAEIEAGRQQAIQAGAAKDLDVRQHARWKNLADELARRKSMAEKRSSVPAKK
jgi:hypothetical protein